MADNDDFDYEYDPLFDVNTQCSCEDPVEEESLVKKEKKMKENIQPFEHAAHILDKINKGILLTSKAGSKLNTMTIAWGMMGIEWAEPIFTVFVRKSRYTHTLLEENPQFSINVPMGVFDRKILGVAGTKSGRDIDKIATLGLTPEDPLVISVPGFREFPLTLECEIVYKQLQDKNSIPQAYREKFYPEGQPADAGTNNFYHVAYYGKIVAAYIIK